MRIVFRIRIDDPRTGGRRRFKYRAEIPYPHAPRVGEGVVIPTNSIEYNLGARHVEEVIYNLDGSVTLDFSLDGLVNDPTAQIDMIIQSGYQEILDD
jgi:hypothetical protein